MQQQQLQRKENKQLCKSIEQQQQQQWPQQQQDIHTQKNTEPNGLRARNSCLEKCYPNNSENGTSDRRKRNSLNRANNEILSLVCAFCLYVETVEVDTILFA